MSLRHFLRTERALIDVYGEELTLQVIMKLNLLKYGHTRDTPTIMLCGLIESMSSTFHVRSMLKEVLGFLDSSTSGNPTPSLDPILSTSFPSLTPFEGGDFILKEIDVVLQE
ncbi:hypothetical protein Tco_1165635 [Tanacetum coccineum]